MTKFTGAPGVIVFFHLLNAALCIPLDDFYAYGGDAPEQATKLAQGDNSFSDTEYVDESIYFYDNPQEAVIVSS